MIRSFKYSVLVFFFMCIMFSLSHLYGLKGFAVLLSSLFCALVFYVYFEKPLLKLTRNITSKRSSDVRVKHASWIKKLFLGTMFDLDLGIHRVKRTQRAMINDLALEKDKLSAILLQMFDGVMMLDADDIIIFCNPAFKRIIGLKARSQTSADGLFIGEFVFRSQILEALDELKQDQRPIEKHISFFDSGVEKYVHLQMVQLGEQKNKRVLITLKDISKDKILEKNKNTMIENVSHELRTPLTVILGHLDIIAQNQDDINKKSYDKIKENVERLIALTEDILKTSNMKEKPFKNMHQAFDPKKMILSVLENYRTIAAQKNIQLEHERNDLIEFKIKGNKDQFYQVIQNLVDNAVKYTQSGTIQVIEKVDKDTFYLSIVDTGVGIETHEKKNIFKRFYRVDRAREKPGTGLGLSIVKAYLDQWSIGWKVKSKPNTGTTFNIEFPIIK